MTDETQKQDTSGNIDQILMEINLAERIRKDDESKGTHLLQEIGNQVCVDYDTDEESRHEWMERNKRWMKLATQVVEKKTHPWDGASNVKYPLLTTASLQFAARAYPSLVPSFDIVKAKVIGPDPEGQMTDAANTLSTHMSYQILHEMDDFEENLDTLCFVLPIVGVMFMKTYYSGVTKKNVIELVHPKDFVVNYYTRSLKTASRYTHILSYTANEIKERQNKKLFLDYEEPFKHGTGNETGITDGKTTGQTVPSPDEDTPRKVLEQFRYLDLDKDDYREPYLVTVDYETKKVLRISPSFFMEDVERDEETGKIQCIHPRTWFTKFGFLPNPDNGFYNLGFGLLLGSLNASINTLVNQLIDSGTLNTLQAGFISKGLRMGGKDVKLKMGEWMPVNHFGDDIRKGIVPLPSNPPSDVLFQLLGVLAQTGKELASIAEIFTGKMPGQNTPAATTMATIEQGLKVFTSIYKRIYRSLQQVYEMIFKLNKLYMPTEVTMFVAETNGEEKTYSVSRDTYEGIKVKIVPASDPNMVSETQKLMKIQGLQELMQMGTVNPQEVTRQALVYQGQENIQALMSMPEPQIPPEIQLKMDELEHQKKVDMANIMLEVIRVQNEAIERQAKAMKTLAEAEAVGMETNLATLQLEYDRMAQDETAMANSVKMLIEQLNQGTQSYKDQVAQQQEAKQKQQEAVQQQQSEERTFGHEERLAKMARRPGN